MVSLRNFCIWARVVFIKNRTFQGIYVCRKMMSCSLLRRIIQLPFYCAEVDESSLAMTHIVTAYSIFKIDL
jgi:hypothetical protein